MRSQKVQKQLLSRASYLQSRESFGRGFCGAVPHSLEAPRPHAVLPMFSPALDLIPGAAGRGPLSTHLRQVQARAVPSIVIIPVHMQHLLPIDR